MNRWEALEGHASLLEFRMFEGSWADQSVEEILMAVNESAPHPMLYDMLAHELSEEELDYFFQNVLQTCDGCGCWFNPSDLEEDEDSGEQLCGRCEYERDVD